MLPSGEQTIYRPETFRPTPLPRPQRPHPDNTMANMSAVMSEVERDRLLQSLNNAPKQQSSGSQSKRFAASNMSVNSQADTLIGQDSASDVNENDYDDYNDDDDDDMQIQPVPLPLPNPNPSLILRNNNTSNSHNNTHFSKSYGPDNSAKVSTDHQKPFSQSIGPKQSAKPTMPRSKSKSFAVIDPRIKQIFSQQQQEPKSQEPIFNASASVQPTVKIAENSLKFIKEEIKRLETEKFDGKALLTKMPNAIKRIRKQAATEVNIYYDHDYHQLLQVLSSVSKDFKSPLPTLQIIEGGNDSDLAKTAAEEQMLMIAAGIPRAKKSTDPSYRKTLDQHRPDMRDVPLPEWPSSSSIQSITNNKDTNRAVGRQAALIDFFHNRRLNSETPVGLEVGPKCLNFDYYNRIRIYQRPIEPLDSDI